MAYQLRTITCTYTLLIYMRKCFFAFASFNITSLYPWHLIFLTWSRNHFTIQRVERTEHIRKWKERQTCTHICTYTIHACMYFSITSFLLKAFFHSLVKRDAITSWINSALILQFQLEFLDSIDLITFYALLSPFKSLLKSFERIAYYANSFYCRWTNGQY